MNSSWTKTQYYIYNDIVYIILKGLHIYVRLGTPKSWDHIYGAVTPSLHTHR
jgi:hypothetical protein